MRKEMLRRLRTLNATPAIIDRAKNDKPILEETKRWYDNSLYMQVKSLHRYGYYLRCQTLNGIIKVAAFTPLMIQQGIVRPAFEIFLNVDGEEYITRYLDEKGNEKWSTSMISNLEYLADAAEMFNETNINIYGYLYHCDKAAWMNPEGTKTIKKALKTKARPYEAILAFQMGVKEKKRDAADAKVFKPWDDDLRLFPKIPQSFINWSFKENTEHYIFYNAGAKEGYCSRCKRMVPISGQRHKKEGKCPVHKGWITYLANGKRSKYLQTAIAESQIIQPIEGGYVIQVIQTQRSYSNYGTPLDFIKPKLRWNPLYKIIIKGDKAIGYKEGFYKQRIWRWIPDPWLSFGRIDCRLYRGNLKRIKEMFPHSAAPILIDKQIDISFPRYMEMERRYPVLESLIKIGLYDIVKDIMRAVPVRESFKQPEAAKALELDGSRLKKLVDLGGSVVIWNWLRIEKRNDTVYDSDMLRYFDRSHFGYSDFNFINDRMSYMSLPASSTRYVYLGRMRKTGMKSDL